MRPIVIDGLELNRVVSGGYPYCKREWIKKVGAVGILFQEHIVDEAVGVMSRVRANIIHYRTALASVAESMRKEQRFSLVGFCFEPTTKSQGYLR